MEKIFIVKDIRKKVRLFNLLGRSLEFKIKPVPVQEDPVKWIRSAINQIIEVGTHGLKPNDQVGFTFCSKDFQRGEGWISFKPADKVSYDDIWNVISSIYQSNSAGINTETFCLGITSVRMPVGTGNNRQYKYNSFNEECIMRRGIVTIKNEDNLCLPRALVVAIAKIKQDSEYSKVRKDTGKIQTQRALKLMEDAGVTIPQEGASISELEKFQRYLQDFKIVVYSYGSKGRITVFEGISDSNKKINLLYHERHYNVITSLTAAFCCSYFCEECLVPYNTKNDHRCSSTCPACQQTPVCLNEQVKIKCDDCKRYFRGRQCYDQHKKVMLVSHSTVCEKIRRCEHCLKTVKSDRDHICGEIYCKTCKSHVSEDHQCYIQLDVGKPKTKDLLFIFYDLETTQETNMGNESYLHHPNLCVFKQCCDECLSTDVPNCKKCGFRLHVLKVEPISRFVEFILHQRRLFKRVVVIAHNGQAFDHQFILNHILTHTDLTPNLIMRGTKIVIMDINNIRFLDSLNYFPMPLSNLPKSFGLGDSFKKGYFPHFFNTLENQNYVGVLPAKEFYDPDNMKENDRTVFLKWYEEHKNDIFNMQRDLVEYCISDVEILTRACLKFREQLLETTNVCPFTEASTIAATCNKVFRRNFLTPNTIGIIPKNGYRWRDNQSKIAIQWMIWEERQRNINITHAAKQQEIIVRGVKVDGFCSETNQVFEFHGCYFHGCIHCYKYGRDEPLHDNPSETFNLRRDATAAKTDRLKDLGFEVIEMWECDFKKQMNEEIKIYTQTHPLIQQTPLQPRDAFYGGRTGNTKAYYKIKEEEKIKYVDVCSLYPYVCKYGKFPIGHPKIIVGEDCEQLNLEKTEGIIKCKILPPQELYHPVLPLKMNNKLMFVLCRTCGEQMNQQECTHNDAERTLFGTWVIDEVNKALEVNYKMIKIYEVWEYNTLKFNKSIKQEGLFTSMMNKFIKIKQQASGWPNNCTAQEDREAYIKEFLEREDVALEFNEIEENPGLRSLAKLILNSFWGKFGQRENQPRTKIVNEPSVLWSMLANPAITINTVMPINEKVIIINYEFTEESYAELSTVNVAVAAYVTAQARLKLYRYLEQIGDRVLYYDTDSVLYVSRPGEYEVETGRFVGDMTDELETYGPGSFITEFVSGGPKNYAFKVFSTNKQQEDVVCKVKGISITYSAAQVVNFEIMKALVLNPSDPVHIISRNMHRTQKHQIITRSETKIYKPNSTKRKFTENHDSIPYGFKKMQVL